MTSSGRGLNIVTLCNKIIKQQYAFNMWSRLWHFLFLSISYPAMDGQRSNFPRTNAPYTGKTINATTRNLHHRIHREILNIIEAVSTEENTYSPFFSTFGPHSKMQFENSTRFLETLAGPEKAHFCLKFSKNRLKLKKSNPVVAVRECYYYL